MNNPTVFISYSHDNDSHKSWVLKLANDLRAHGVNAKLDQWDLQIGADLRLFMENGLSDSDFVLCICSEEYVRKFNSGVGGSGYEGMVMTQSMLQNVKSEFLIPVVRNNSSADRVPVAFGSKFYIDFSNDEQYEIHYQELLERIYGEDLKRKPPLGSNPFSSEMADIIEQKTKIETIQYCSPMMDGSVSFRFDNNNGQFTIGSGEYEFSTRWSRSGNDSIHAYGTIGFKTGECEFPAFQDLCTYDFSSNARTIHTGQIVIFMNKYKHFAAIKLGEVKSSSHGNPYDEMFFKYHIYVIA